MSDAVIQSIVTGLVAIALAWIALKQAQVHGEVKKIARDVNGHTQLLVAATKKVGHAEGVEDERAEQRARTQADLSAAPVEPNDVGHD